MHTCVSLGNGDLGAKALIIDNALGCIVEIIAAKNCLDTYSKGVISMALKLVHKCSDEGVCDQFVFCSNVHSFCTIPQQ